MSEPVEVARRTAVPWGAVILYVVIAFGLAWAICSPLWIGGQGLAAPSASLLLIAMMYTPAVAALVVTFAVQRPPRGARARALSLVPLRPWRRTLGYAALAIVVPIVVVALGIAVSAALGLVRLDLVHFSGFAAVLRAQLHGATPPLPIPTLVALQLVQLVPGAIINGLFTFGEELGWRGWLLPALRPLGTWPALLITGAVWGLWHAPIILLGYDFARPGLDGLGLMVVGTVLAGILIGWLRMRSSTIWPSVFAHGSLNAVGGLIVVVVAAHTTADPALAGPLGAVVWGIEAVVVALLVLSRRFRWRDPVPAPASELRRLPPPTGSPSPVREG